MSPTTPGVRAKVLTRLIFILWVLLAPHLHAQTDAGELKVLVVDPSDAVVAAAAVNLTRTDTEIRYSCRRAPTQRVMLCFRRSGAPITLSPFP